MLIDNEKIKLTNKITNKITVNNPNVNITLILMNLSLLFLEATHKFVLFKFLNLLLCHTYDQRFSLRSPVTSILVNSLDSSKSSSCLIISTWRSLSSHHSRHILHLAYRIPRSLLHFLLTSLAIFLHFLLLAPS